MWGDRVAPAGRPRARSEKAETTKQIANCRAEHSNNYLKHNVLLATTRTIRLNIPRAQAPLGGSDFELDRLVALCPACHAQTVSPAAPASAVSRATSPRPAPWPPPRGALAVEECTNLR